MSEVDKFFEKLIEMLYNGVFDHDIKYTLKVSINTHILLESDIRYGGGSIFFCGREFTIRSSSKVKEGIEVI